MALTYRIVRAEADSDFGKIRQLYYETCQSAYRDLMPASYLQQLTPATWRPERRWQNMLLAMTADGEVVGVCTFGPARHANYEGWGELYSLYVHPNYHHHGIGQQLIIQAHRRLKAVYPQNYLLVLANNAVAQRFYQRNGFHDTGQIYVDHAPFGVLHERIFED